MKRIKLKIARVLIALFPKAFCWTSLVHWVHGGKLRNSIGSHACQDESLGELLSGDNEDNTRACYCGHWVHGHCAGSRAYNKFIEERDKRIGVL